MNILKDFQKKFGKATTEAILSHAGAHTHEDLSKVKKLEDMLAFALMEIIDFECYAYGDSDIPKELTKETIMKFCIDHKAEIRTANIPPPSYLGLFLGKFSFLVEKESANRPIVVYSTHPRFAVGTRLDWGFFGIAIDEGYTILCMGGKPTGKWKDGHTKEAKTNGN